MKIDQLNNIATTLASGQAQGQKPETAFSSYLNEALQEPSAAKPLSNPVPPSFTMPVFDSQLSQDGPLQQEAVRRGESLLACLGEYQELLADQHKSLKDVGSGMERLEEELKQMGPVLDRLDERDPLSQVLQSISSLALVEAVKFRRGDYS